MVHHVPRQGPSSIRLQIFSPSTLALSASMPGRYFWKPVDTSWIHATAYSRHSFSAAAAAAAEGIDDGRARG